MRRANWLCLVVCVASGAPAYSAERVPAFPETASAVPASHVHDEAPVLKDLTPAGFADIVPPPAPHHGSHEGQGERGDWCATGCVTHEKHHGWYASGEYLLMRPRADAYDFAVRGLTPGLATVGPVESLKSALGSGFRAEAGFRLSCGWEAGVAYTLLNSGGSRTLSAGTGGVLYPTITRPA